MVKLYKMQYILHFKLWVRGDFYMKSKLELEVRRDSLMNKGTHNAALVAKITRKLRRIEN
ncbi:hypothetical protein GCM10008916_08980 [Clostridium nitritogenes]|uniref:Uncharacterized protein n=1 Tax=Clostridium nitritogenes TaxID=83340 RepID=A0ABN1LJX0_9CLOT